MEEQGPSPRKDRFVPPDMRGYRWPAFALRPRRTRTGVESEIGVASLVG